MFVINNVSKTYNGSGKSKESKKTVKAVDSLSLTVNNGEIFGFLGPNGAGKTTTIRMLTGIIEPTEGDLLLDGISITKEAVSAKRQFSFVPDNPESFSRLKGIEYLTFIADVYKVSQEERKALIEKYCERFGIKEVLNNKIASFSHGMKQKLFLVASLISNPQNWILDEPMVGLDPEAAFIVKEIMRERANEGKTVFFSTHVMEVAEKLCDRIGIIQKGKLIFAGTFDELKKQYGTDGSSLEEIFLKLVSTSGE